MRSTICSAFTSLHRFPKVHIIYSCPSSLYPQQTRNAQTFKLWRETAIKHGFSPTLSFLNTNYKMEINISYILKIHLKLFDTDVNSDILCIALIHQMVHIPTDQTVKRFHWKKVMYSWSHVFSRSARFNFKWQIVCCGLSLSSFPPLWSGQVLPGLSRLYFPGILHLEAITDARQLADS